MRSEPMASASRMADLKAAPMLAHDYTPLFRLDHMLKDVKLATQMGIESAAPMPLPAPVTTIPAL